MRLVAAFVALTTTWLVATWASAQDLDDIPPPEELGAVTASGELRIEWPAQGDRVQTPFTMTGVAPPGARLELWIGDELQRVFLADANGRFNTAVARGTGEIVIHQVDKAGARVKSVSVSVVWGGKGEPVAASSAATPAATGDEAAPQRDPFGPEGAVATASGLPRVSELDAEGGAATPPPPTAGAWSEAPPAEASGAPSPALEEPVVLKKKRPRTPSRGVRVAGEAGAGLTGAAALGFGGVLVGFGIGLASRDVFVAIGAAAVGGAIGWAIGLPVGVILAGNMMDGNGAWWAVVLGEIVGLAVAGGLASAMSDVVVSGTLPVLLVVTLPLAGAVIGYEATSDRSAWEAEHSGAAVRSWTPTVGVSRDGEPTLGLKLRF